MFKIKQLSYLFSELAGMSDKDFELSTNYWKEHSFRKGEYFNKYQSVCKYMGFVFDGVFRGFVIDSETGEEKNIFFYSKNQFVVSFKSFIYQIPCDYHTQSMTDSKVLCISYYDLMKLYQESHAWERFGRLVAQEAANVLLQRTEGLLFRSVEERYLELVERHPEIFDNIPLYHISSYLGIQGPSLSRIRKRLAKK